MAKTTLITTKCKYFFDQQKQLKNIINLADGQQLLYKQSGYAKMKSTGFTMNVTNHGMIKNRVCISVGGRCQKQTKYFKTTEEAAEFIRFNFVNLTIPIKERYVDKNYGNTGFTPY